MIFSAVLNYMAVLGSQLNDSTEGYDSLLKTLIKFSGEANFWKDSGGKTQYLPSGERYDDLFEYERGYLKGNLYFYENLLKAISRARGVIERNDPQWLELYRLEEFFKKRLKSLPYAPFLELVKDYPEGNVIHQIIEAVFKRERPLAALFSSPDKDSYLERQIKDVFTYADSMEENLQAAFLNSFLAHFDAINSSPQNLKYRLRVRKAIEEYIEKTCRTSSSLVEPQQTGKPKGKASDCLRLIELIESGQIEEALKCLSKQDINATHLLARYNRTKREYHVHTISFEEWDKVQSQITVAALDLAKKHNPTNA